MLRRTPLKKRGPKADAWKLFRDDKFEKDNNEEGLIRCQGTKMGLKDCYTSASYMHLHHVIGRDADPSKYFDDENLVWLTPTCHALAHGEIV